MLDQAQQKIETELKVLIGAAVKQVTDTIGEMSDKISDSSKEASSERETVKPLFDQLKHFLDPIEEGIDGLKRAASTVGIDF